MATAKSIKLNDNTYWDTSSIATDAGGSKLNGLFYDSTFAYEAGDIVLYATSGTSHYKMYLCIQAGTNKTPSSETTYWTPVFVSSQ